MKQLIIIETSEQQSLRSGRPLTLRFGDQTVDVAFEMNGRRSPSTTKSTKKQPSSIQCKQCEHKPFKTHSKFMKHRRAEHPNGKR